MRDEAEREQRAAQGEEPGLMDHVARIRELEHRHEHLGLPTDRIRLDADAVGVELLSRHPPRVVR
jgi:hypothetical protein